MSIVRDLEIRGVRNFGDENSKARIHFSKPLTLILGPNGTGKTTIIESLKYVTSGEYPPESDRGKSFVHEPKLTQNHTVRGQVKAKIIDKKGQELIVVRSMQVSRQKSGALKFAALDNTITRLDPNTKEKLQISSRCVDIDREMLISMGVSKPILNYVIFCHQEESNWPLEDGKKLKERFDEIFDTSKYNKAMETATKFIKELNSELKTIKAHEDGLKAIVDEVESQEKKLRDNEEREQETQSRILQIEEDIVPIDIKLEKISNLRKEYLAVENEKNKIETEYTVTKNYIDSIKKHIKELHLGSKEELMERLDTYEYNLTQKKERKHKFVDNFEAIERNLKSLTSELDNSRVKLGSLNTKKAAYDDKVERRNELLKKSLKSWDIVQIDSSFEEKDVKDYVKKIEEKIREFVNTAQNKIEENEQEERHLQREVDAQRSEKTGIDSEISLKEKEMEEIKIELKEIKKKMGETKEACNRLTSIETNRKIYEEKYDNLKQSFDEDVIKEELQKDISSKKQLDTKISQIDCEINSLHQQSSQQAELELTQKRLRDEDEHITSIKEKHKDNLDLLFDGREIPQNNFKFDLEKIQRSLNSERNNLLNQIETEQKKVATLQTTLKIKQTELSKLTAELERSKQKVASECQDNDYNEILNLQEKKVKSLQDQRGIYSNQSSMYNEFIKQLKKKSCCPLCDRKFSSTSEERQLEKKLFAEIETSPQNLEDCEKKLKIEQKRYDVLQQLKPVTEQISKLENDDLPKIKSFLAKTKADLENSEQSLENLKFIIAEPEEKLAIYKLIIGDISLLDNHIKTRNNLNDVIETKKREMLKAGKIGDRSMKEAQNEREVMKERLNNIEKKIEKTQSSLQDYQEKLQIYREQRNKYDEEAIKIRQDEQALNALKSKTKELYAKDESLGKSIRQLRQKLVIAEEELAKREEDLDNLKKQHRAEQEKDSSFKSISNTHLHELKNIQQEVDKLVKENIKENLSRVETEVERLTKESENKKIELSTLDEQIRFLDDQCRSQETGKKDLETNLDLIKKQEQLEKSREELENYKKKLKDMKMNDVMKEYTSLEEKKDELLKEKNLTKGAYGELVNTIKSLKKNLNQEKYRMARKNHKKYSLQLVVQEQAISNLKTYITVLDKAMINFHEERMSTVNKIMKQLWNLVYSGNDTSSIQIRVNTTEGIGDKRRSYNYKLVQVKRSTEMDMKGKCSAGQKVLASIIIRMALAETFCSDCAVLALDEPTTNLDEENATNLAVTLSKVIQLRAQHHKNFQLIVISHDEKFISHLSNLSGKQGFQELYRNEEGFSLVRRRDVSQYMVNSNSQNGDEVYDSEEEEEDTSSRKSIKRNFDFENSPPRQAFKRRAY